MNDLAAHQNNLPAAIEDVARFIVLGQEKAKSLSAEIKAIKRLDLAKEVYDQKMSELTELRCLMFDAYYKMGEFTQALPKDTAFKGNQHEEVNSRLREDTKTKAETIKDIGLSTSQVQRFETMSRHPEIIEQVKSEAKAGLTEPTQTEVLRRIKEAENVTSIAEIRQEREVRKSNQNVDDALNVQEFHKFIHGIATATISDEIIDSIIRFDDLIDDTMFDVSFAISLLTSVRNKLITRRCKDGKAN